MFDVERLSCYVIEETQFFDGAIPVCGYYWTGSGDTDVATTVMYRKVLGYAGLGSKVRISEPFYMVDFSDFCMVLRVAYREWNEPTWKFRFLTNRNRWISCDVFSWVDDAKRLLGVE